MTKTINVTTNQINEWATAHRQTVCFTVKKERYTLSKTQLSNTQTIAERTFQFLPLALR